MLIDRPAVSSPDQQPTGESASPEDCPEVSFEEIAMNSSVRSAGACLARAEGASWWREQRALCSFRPAALYSADTQAWSGGGEYAQGAGIDSSKLRSVLGCHGTTTSAHCGNRDGSHREHHYRIHRSVGERRGHEYPGGGNSRPETRADSRPGGRRTWHRVCVHHCARKAYTGTQSRGYFRDGHHRPIGEHRVI